MSSEETRVCKGGLLYTSCEKKRNNRKTSGSDPRGVLGHGGGTYNDETCWGLVRQARDLVHERDLER